MATIADLIPGDALLARLDEVARAWSGDVTAEPAEPPVRIREGSR